MENKNQDPSIKLTQRGKLAVKIGALVAAGAAVFTLHGQGHEAEKPEPVGTYTVQPGDTLSNVAEEVAQNTPQHETMQQAAENIRDINGLRRYPDIAEGQKLEVPLDADVNEIEPGVQLVPDRTVHVDMKYANRGQEPTEGITPASPTTEQLPTPVVPDESGLNPNTPR